MAKLLQDTACATDVESACGLIMRIARAAHTNLPPINETVHAWLIHSKCIHC